MFTLNLDADSFVRQADDMDAAHDQLPYVVSRLLNDAVFKARQVLVEQTWPEHVHVRNTNFIRAALHVERSTKHNLTAKLVDVIGRAHLYEHVYGGTKQAAGKNLAIPNADWVHYTQHGVAARP